MTAQDYVNAIRANIDATYDDQITMEQFRAVAQLPFVDRMPATFDLGLP